SRRAEPGNQLAEERSELRTVAEEPLAQACVDEEVTGRSPYQRAVVVDVNRAPGLALLRQRPLQLALGHAARQIEEDRNWPPGVAVADARAAELAHGELVNPHATKDSEGLGLPDALAFDRPGVSSVRGEPRAVAGVVRR